MAHKTSAATVIARLFYLLILVSISARAEAAAVSVDTPVLTPAVIVPGFNGEVLVTVRVRAASDLLEESAILLVTDIQGRTLQKKGALRIDQTLNTISAGDRWFTGRFVFADAFAGLVYLRVSVAQKGQLRRSLSPVTSLRVTTLPTSNALSPFNLVRLSVDLEGKNAIVCDELFVKFSQSITSENLRSLLTDARGSVVGNAFGYQQVRLDGCGMDHVKSAMAFFSASPFVVDVASNDVVTSFSSVVPNDPDVLQQWGLARIKAPGAWSIMKVGVPIGIVDSGLAYAHEDLRSNVVLGRDFCGSVDQFRSCIPDDDPIDEFGHGTAVASIAAAESDNNRGMAGVAFHAQLIIEKVFALETCPQIGLGQHCTSVGIIALAIEDAVLKGAKVVNLSLGQSKPNSLYLRAVEFAASKGAVVIAAAGNGNSDAPNYPAALENVISVAASDEGNNRSKWSTDTGGPCANAPPGYASSFGDWVSLYAPGTRIWAASIATPASYESSCGSGTSSAAPFVSGVASLMLSANPQLVPAEIKEILVSTATRTGQVDSPNGREIRILDAEAAVRSATAAFARDDQFGVRQGDVLTVAAPGVLKNDSIHAVIQNVTFYDTPTGFTDVGDGAFRLNTASINATVTFSYLIQTDDGRSNVGFVVVSILPRMNSDPSATFSMTDGAQLVLHGDILRTVAIGTTGEARVSFTDTSTDPDGGSDIVFRLWTTNTGCTPAHPPPCALSEGLSGFTWSFRAGGPYIVTLLVRDSAGNESSATGAVIVSPSSSEEPVPSTDPTAFLAAVQGYSMVTFDDRSSGFEIPAGASPGGISYSFNAQGFSGLITGEWLAVSSPNTLGVNRIGVPNGNFFFPGDSVTLAFPPTRAIGAYFASNPNAGTAQGFISITTPEGTALSADALPSGSFGFGANSLRFVGLTSSRPFTTATFAIANPSPGNVGFVVDNVILGTGVPGPVPTISTLIPASLPAGNADRLVDISGSNFFCPNGNDPAQCVTVEVRMGDMVVGILQAPGQVHNVTANSFRMIIKLGTPGEYLLSAINPDGTRSQPFALIAVDSPPLSMSPWPVNGHDAQHTGRSQFVGPPLLVTPTSTRMRSGLTTNGSAVIDSRGVVYLVSSTVVDGASVSVIGALHPDGSEAAGWPYIGPANSQALAVPSIGPDGTIYAAFGGDLYAIRPDGTNKWSEPFHVPGRIFASPTIAPDGTIYVVGNGSPLFALNPDRSVKWQAHGVDPFVAVTLGHDGTLFVNGGPTVSSARGASALKPDGTVLWTNSFGGNIFRPAQIGSPVIGLDGIVYAVLTGGDVPLASIVGIDPQTGHIVYERSASPTSIGGNASQLAVAPDGSIIYVDSGRFTSDGLAHVLGLSSDLNAVRIDYNLGPDYYSSFALAIDASGMIYAPLVGYNQTANLVVISPNGSKQWEYSAPANSYIPPPVIATDGTLVVSIGSYVGSSSTLLRFVPRR